MRNIEELDPYALTSYSFTLGKTNSFFTRVTVIITIAILTASVMLNYSSVCHLWLPRSELPVIATQTLAFPPPLTHTLACFKSTAPNKTQIPPSAKFYNSRGDEILLPTVSAETVKISNPLLHKQIGDNFSCLNLEGIEFSLQNREFYIDVDSPKASLYLTTASFKSIVDTFEATAMVFSSVASIFYEHIHIQFIYTKIFDSLFVSSQPEVTATVLENFNINYIDFTPAPINSTGSKFGLKIFIPEIYQGYSAQQNCNLTEIEMRRLDIAFILGAVLSWVSIFAFIFSFFVAPIMDYFLNLQLSKTIFQVPSRFSSPSLVRYIISNFKSGLFSKQDYYLKLCERLEKLMDMSITLKLLKILKQLAPSSKRVQALQQIISDYSFTDTPTEQIVNSYQENHSNTPIQFQQSSDNSSGNKLSQIRKSIFKWFDAGSDIISVNFDGSGYGSKQSLFLSSGIFIGFIIIMVVIGAADSTVTQTTIKSKGQQIVRYHFQERQIIVLAYRNISPKAKLIDGQFNLIRYLNVISGDKCLQKLSNNEKKQLTNKALYYYCLTDSFDLISSLNTKDSIQLNMYTDTFVDFQLYAYHSQPASIKQTQNVPQSFQLIKFYGPAGSFYDMVCIQIVENTNTNEQFAQFIYSKPGILNNLTPTISGALFTINRQKVIVTTEQSNFFDVLANIWSFSVICFSVVLMKITKYINMGYRNRRISEERADYKSNICVLLAKTHGLINGRNKVELGKLKYYTKEKLKLHEQ